MISPMYMWHPKCAVMDFTGPLAPCYADTTHVCCACYPNWRREKQIMCCIKSSMHVSCLVSEHPKAPTNSNRS